MTLRYFATATTREGIANLQLLGRYAIRGDLAEGLCPLAILPGASPPPPPSVAPVERALEAVASRQRQQRPPDMAWMLLEKAVALRPDLAGLVCQDCSEPATWAMFAGGNVGGLCDTHIEHHVP